MSVPAPARIKQYKRRLLGPIEAGDFFRWRYGETDGWKELLDDRGRVAELVRKVMSTRGKTSTPCGLMED